MGETGRRVKELQANDAGTFGSGLVTMFADPLDYWLVRYRKDAMHDPVIGRQGRRRQGCACGRRICPAPAREDGAVSTG